jgi:hypothetical protein
MRSIIILYNYSQYDIDMKYMIEASEECGKGETVEVTGDAPASCLKSRL